MSTEILFGINTAEEILKAGRRRVLRLVISRSEKNQRIQDLASLARKNGVTVDFCDPRTLEKLAAGGHHQGVIIETEPMGKLDADEAVGLEKDMKKTVWAGLDSITDP